MKSEEESEVNESEKDINQIENSAAFKNLESELEGLPPEQKQKVILEVKRVTSRAMSMSFSGPILPPQILNGYNGIIEGGATRVVEMSEREQAHRHKQDEKDFEVFDSVAKTDNQLRIEDFKLRRNSQIFGFIIVLFCISSSVFLAYNNHEVVAGVIGGTTVVSLAGIFIANKLTEYKKKEEEIDAEDNNKTS